MGRPVEVVGVQRTKDRIGCHAVIEPSGQIIEPVWPHEVIERVGDDLRPIRSNPNPRLSLRA